MSGWRLLGTSLIWAIAINGLSRWAGHYCWWWCPFTGQALTDLSFWSAVVSMVLFLAAVFAVDGLAWAVGRWKR